ncbi:MAG: transporter [Deltaproteobacteria bacterium]|nr:transporter [Deltaproteobacteria bacterium]
MLRHLIENQLLLVFVIAALGFLLGQVRLGGFRLGIAGVLFAGLAVSATSPAIKLEPLVYELGLVLFIYGVGLSSGPHFVASLHRDGLKQSGLVVLVLCVCALLAFGLARLEHLSPGVAVGIFSGAFTSTPALASVLEVLRGYPAGAAEPLGDPVVGYAIAYPMGVVGVMLAIYLVQRLFRVDYAAEARALHQDKDELVSQTVRVTLPLVGTVKELAQGSGWNVRFARLKHEGHREIVTGDTRFEVGDLVSCVGHPTEVADVARVLGEPCAEALELEHSPLDFRRIFVSSPDVVGRPLASLCLKERFGAIVTRIRRGDRDVLPRGDTPLELGDRVRVVCERTRMKEVSRFFGDSYRQLSEIDVVTFGLGIALGLLVGMIAIPLPGGGRLQLGAAGGTLLVALTLGALGRTGPLVWQMPYSANLTLRQVGLVVFLAGVGVRSGHRFAAQMSTREGLWIFLTGTGLTAFGSLCLLLLGYRVLEIPYSVLIGLLAGFQTQPAVLAFAGERTGNDLPQLGYAVAVPAAMVVKILAAQVLLFALTQRAA